MADGLSISIADRLTPTDLERIEALLPQLSSTARFDAERVISLLEAPDADLFVARESGRIVGMATLATAPLLTGWHGSIEDVVVDQSVRGRGIARLLLEAIIDESERRGLPTLDLTSRPSRESALRLYESVGFVRRNTNVLRFGPRSS
ncbi:GNAT family N-acetyltransferase [Microbacterium sp. APC 3901]|uniref:GNAT family N-acetyltransferase n=1 Tax=Microbacterium sp. APC 3901 TaxID=3035192 RepID=UPI0025B578A9|nr:GNAT family N-acetyltransferase [Microbacterium sp. APC 3901]MDN3444806.1 GNAT family N-acetyltransferase [Microbacterium sp. APC 3901]